jgi:Na+-transporting NADH:ubiquinone oxidoreductase subunit A
MEYKLKTKKGLNIRLQGEAISKIIAHDQPEMFAIKPIDFNGLTPKVIAKPDTIVKIGTPLFYDKYHPEVLFVSPISGTVTEIVRGEKRKILQINIKNNYKSEVESLSPPDVGSTNRQQLVDYFCKAGLWPFIKQRPYGVVAKTTDVPKSIFVSLYDTAPLAPDFEFLFAESIDVISTALAYLSQLTQGNVYVGLPVNSKIKDAISHIERVQVITVSGPHPAGNVGTLINKFDPINKDEVVFTFGAIEIIHIGNTIMKKHFCSERTVALTGSEIKEPCYVKTWLGAQVTPILDNRLRTDNVRVISGNVLTGKNIGKNGMLGFFDNQICVIPEGNHYEFLGWIMPGFKKFSVSRTFLSFLTPKKKYRIDTNFHGGHRAYVVTGEYEKVCPLDILPQHLIKAIITNDIDKMEQLGIYEVIEEDFALCEFVCTSKIEVQKILREGLDIMREEMS